MAEMPMAWAHAPYPLSINLHLWSQGYPLWPMTQEEKPRPGTYLVV